MRPQAHVASALLVWSASGAPVSEAPLDVVAGNVPDFDRNLARLLDVEGRAHHRWVSHSFAGWIGPTVWAGRRGRATRRRIALVWVHLLLDTYADGIAWLWPLDREKRGLFRRPPGSRDRGWSTPAPLSTELGRAELAMWLLTAASVARRLSRRGR